MGPAVAWRGVWSDSLTYKADDAVTYEGSSYVAVRPTTPGTAPPDDPADWQLLAKEGGGGRPGLRWRGEYDDDTQYAQNDAVRYDDNLYIATSEPPAGTNPTDTQYWSLLFDSNQKAVTSLAVADTLIAGGALALSVVGAFFGVGKAVSQVTSQVEEGIEKALGAGGKIASAISKQLDDAVKAGGTVATAIDQSIDAGLSGGGKIASAISSGAKDAISEGLADTGSITAAIRGGAGKAIQTALSDEGAIGSAIQEGADTAGNIVYENLSRTLEATQEAVGQIEAWILGQ